MDNFVRYLLIVFVNVSSVLLFVESQGNKLTEHSSNHKCTKIQRTEKIATMYESGPCIQSYKARCGWFSLDLCTFYKEEICDKNSNITQYKYSTVYACCDGFIEAPNRTCISIESADPKWVILKENNTDVVYVNAEDIPTTTSKSKAQKLHQKVDEKAYDTGVSKGALAGAACGLVFIIIVVAFTIIGIKKRRARRAKNKPKKDTEIDEADQTMLTTSF